MLNFNRFEIYYMVKFIHDIAIAGMLLSSVDNVCVLLLLPVMNAFEYFLRHAQLMFFNMNMLLCRNRLHLFAVQLNGKTKFHNKRRRRHQTTIWMDRKKRSILCKLLPELHANHFYDFNRMYNGSDNKIIKMSNGLTRRRWLRSDQQYLFSSNGHHHRSIVALAAGLWYSALINWCIWTLWRW